MQTPDSHRFQGRHRQATIQLLVDSFAAAPALKRIGAIERKPLSTSLLLAGI